VVFCRAADSAGIVVGDLLESIDQEFLSLDGSMTHHDINDLLRGPPGYPLSVCLCSPICFPLFLNLEN